MQELYLCDKCGGLSDRELINIQVKRGSKNAPDITEEWSICDFCEEAAHYKPGGPIPQANVTFTPPTEVKPARTDGKRVIRTKSTGDRVYLIDETAKTKAWVTSPDILEKLGFAMSDVEDVEDSSLVGYAMTASVYKAD